MGRLKGRGRGERGAGDGYEYSGVVKEGDRRGRAVGKEREGKSGSII